MKKSIFKNIKVEEIIKSMESKFFTIFKRYDAGNLNISLSYINIMKNRYMEITQKLYLQAL